MLRTAFSKNILSEIAVSHLAFISLATVLMLLVSGCSADPASTVYQNASRDQDKLGYDEMTYDIDFAVVDSVAIMSVLGNENNICLDVHCFTNDETDDGGTNEDFVYILGDDPDDITDFQLADGDMAMACSAGDVYTVNVNNVNMYDISSGDLIRSN